MTSSSTDREPAAVPAAASSPIDYVKVARLRADLEAGSYRTDSAAVAEAMIAADLPPIEPIE